MQKPNNKKTASVGLTSKNLPKKANFLLGLSLKVGSTRKNKAKLDMRACVRKTKHMGTPRISGWFAGLKF